MSEVMKIAQMVEITVSIRVDSFESLKSKICQLGGNITDAHFIGLDTTPVKTKKAFNGRVDVTKYHVQRVKIAQRKNPTLIAREIKELAEVPNSVTVVRYIMQGEYDDMLKTEE